MFCVAGFLLAFAECFGVPSPFTACGLVILSALGEKRRYFLLGCAVSTLLRFLWHIELDIWQLAGCIVLASVPPRHEHSAAQLLALTALGLAPRAIAALFSPLPSVFLHAALSMAIGLVTAPALFHAAKLLLYKRKTSYAADDLLCLLVLLVPLLTGAGYLRIGPVNVGQLCMTVLLLCTAWVGGCAAGVCCGMVCGAACALALQSAYFMICLAVCGLGAGLFRGKRRWMACAAFALCDLFSLALVEGAAHVLPAWTVAAGCCLFLLPDEALFLRLKPLLMAPAPAVSMENIYAQEQMRRWAGAMCSMASALPEITAPCEPPAEDFSQTLCGDCERAAQCWAEQNAAHTRLLLENMTRYALMTLPDAQQEEFFAELSQCARREEAEARMAAQQQALRARRAQLSRAQYEQAMTRTHLTAVSLAVRELADMMEGETGEDMQAAFEMERIIKSIGFPARVRYARHVDGHLRVAVQAEPLTFTHLRPERLLAAIHDQLSMNMRAVSGGKNMLLLEELPPLQVEVGRATLCVGSASHSPDNGDAVLLQLLQGGKQMVALSDGMGHGERAQQESRKTLELLSLCLEAGYTREEAITAVNGMMLCATGGELFATVDLCLIDLWTGVMRLEKLGACVSFLMRGNQLKTLAGASLPLGIVENAPAVCCKMRLYEGDLLVMMSDGIQDAWRSQEELEKCVARLAPQADHAQRMADMLLQSALLAAGNVIRDDMTALCVKITGR